MIDLSKYRIIDLSHEMVPGEQKIDGHYLHGEPLFRPLGRGAGVYGLRGPDALHSESDAQWHTLRGSLQIPR